MRDFLLRLYLILFVSISWLQSFAQGEDEGGGARIAKGTDETGAMDDLMSYQSFNIGFSEILLVILVIACCYIFGKIWKGCTYLIILVAVIFFFLSR